MYVPVGSKSRTKGKTRVLHKMCGSFIKLNTQLENGKDGWTPEILLENLINSSMKTTKRNG